MDNRQHIENVKKHITSINNVNTENLQDAVVSLTLDIGTKSDTFLVELFTRTGLVEEVQLPLRYNYSLSPKDFKDTKELRHFMHLNSLNYKFKTLRLVIRIHEPYTHNRQGEEGYFLIKGTRSFVKENYDLFKEDYEELSTYLKDIYIGEDSIAGLYNPFEKLDTVLKVMSN